MVFSRERNTTNKLISKLTKRNSKCPKQDMFHVFVVAMAFDSDDGGMQFSSLAKPYLGSRGARSSFFYRRSFTLLRDSNLIEKYKN